MDHDQTIPSPILLEHTRDGVTYVYGVRLDPEMANNPAFTRPVRVRFWLGDTLMDQVALTSSIPRYELHGGASISKDDRFRWDWTAAWVETVKD